MTHSEYEPMSWPAEPTPMSGEDPAARTSELRARPQSPWEQATPPGPRGPMWTPPAHTAPASPVPASPAAALPPPLVAPPPQAARWWDNGDEPLAAYAEAPWAKELGGSWSPLRDAWKRHS